MLATWGKPMHRNDLDEAPEDIHGSTLMPTHPKAVIAS